MDTFYLFRRIVVKKEQICYIHLQRSSTPSAVLATWFSLSNLSQKYKIANVNKFLSGIKYVERTLNQIQVNNCDSKNSKSISTIYLVILYIPLCPKIL